MPNSVRSVVLSATFQVVVVPISNLCTFCSNHIVFVNLLSLYKIKVARNSNYSTNFVFIVSHDLFSSHFT